MLHDIISEALYYIGEHNKTPSKTLYDGMKEREQRERQVLLQLKSNSNNDDNIDTNTTINTTTNTTNTTSVELVYYYIVVLPICRSTTST